MGKTYSEIERCEALKLAGGIGTRAASERLGINIDTLYTWISKSKAKKAAAAASVPPGESVEEHLSSENARLRRENQRMKEELEILQDAIGFFAERRKK